MAKAAQKKRKSPRPTKEGWAAARKAYEKDGLSMASIGRQLSVSRASVSNHARKNKWIEKVDKQTTLVNEVDVVLREIPVPVTDERQKKIDQLREDHGILLSQARALVQESIGIDQSKGKGQVFTPNKEKQLAAKTNLQSLDLLIKLERQNLDMDKKVSEVEIINKASFPAFRNCFVEEA